MGDSPEAAGTVAALASGDGRGREVRDATHRRACCGPGRRGGRAGRRPRAERRVRQGQGGRPRPAPAGGRRPAWRSTGPARASAGQRRDAGPRPALPGTVRGPDGGRRTGHPGPRRAPVLTRRRSPDQARGHAGGPVHLPGEQAVPGGAPAGPRPCAAERGVRRSLRGRRSRRPPGRRPGHRGTGAAQHAPMASSRSSTPTWSWTRPDAAVALRAGSRRSATTGRARSG